MKTAPITYTEMAIGAGVLVVGYLAWRAYSAVPKSVDAVVAAASDFVDVRDETQPNETWIEALWNGKGFTGFISSEQNFVADTVQKGQDSGSDTFIGAFFTGLFK